MSDQERLLESEARRLSQLLDINYEEVLRALRNLIKKGIVIPDRSQFS